MHNKKPLWVPSEGVINNTNMAKFMRLINKKYAKDLSTYRELYKWSIDNIPDFWANMWDFADIKASENYNAVVEDLSRFPAKWFPGAKLNFAENLLRYKDEHTALVFRGENERHSQISYGELYDKVARLAKSLRNMGVGVGDRVVAYMPNMIETVVAMLASTSIGAIWSSCGTELGPGPVIDRLNQLEPKVLFTANGYFFKGKKMDSLNNAAEIAQGIPSLEKIIVSPYTEEQPDISQIPKSIYFEDFLVREKGLEIQFEQLPAEHPVYVMFSSGTTGKPKCIVQSAIGILINQLKEHLLHSDLKNRKEVTLYITTCSWMMWNWEICTLATGNTIVLYDGNPLYPDPCAMFKLIQDERITRFGCSATYINGLRNQGFTPGRDYDLSSLTEINQTGSALSADGFAWIYDAIKKDLHFNSISGGTDINGCFVAGNPVSPVYPGELQGFPLGVKTNVYDEKGNPVQDQCGELVCETPIPSMPLYFWNDINGEKYQEAYFDVYPNVWRHGDYIILHSDTGGITFYGRSDSVLMPSGVRIGTAEIYNQMEELEEINDSVAVGQKLTGDERILLFVKLSSEFQLTEDLKNKIKSTLRKNASPRHVPYEIIETPDIPYTFNMKKVEKAVGNIINGKAVTNRGALTNPESLDFYIDYYQNYIK